MTAQELANEAIKGILDDPAGENLLRTFASPHVWVRSYAQSGFESRTQDALIESAARFLIEQKILKPDNRKHSGLGPNRGDRYRLSRGWWNRNHRED